MKGGDLERKGHKERLQGPRTADRRTEAVRPSSEGRYRDIRQITNHPGEKPAAISRSTAHTVTGPSHVPLLLGYCARLMQSNIET